VACLLLSLPAHALFLAGQAQQGGEISVLCEGQASAFISFPTGESRALPLDSDFQASILPPAGGPYTIQCGNETKTIAVSLPQRSDSPSFPGGENIFLAAGASIAFIAALLAAAKVLLAPRTIFSKSIRNGRVALFLRAGEDLREIRISDPQGGEGGAPLKLSIPCLPANASWSWEYELEAGEPLLAAHLSAKRAKGGISLISGAEGGGMPGQKSGGKNTRETRKLPRHAG